uniref:Uncharacterized protein n=1 Tax=viral metagenome TaxID=1070528 RepID=A0A6C0D7W3_9ZZZZ
MKTINIKGVKYDITNYKHPGGNVIDSMTDGQDATYAFEEFHYRSKKAKIVLDNLDKISNVQNDSEMLKDFEKFRKSLEEKGFFKPSYKHITFRILELIFIYSIAIYLIPYNIIGSIFLFGIFGGRCGWLQHEGGHNSLTGNIKIDKIIQNISIGFGLLTDGSMWNSMHNRHHANTQKIGYDMDLDTAPLVAFYENALKNNNKIVKYWLKYQAYTFLPITSGIFVMLFWILYLHPRKIIRDKNILQGLIVILGHISRVSLFIYFRNSTVFQGICYHLITLWVSGIYLFGHFALSHTFMPTIEKNENKNWVLNALEHTVDIDPQNKLISWIMGHLNNQVVHHLFLSMPQYRGPEVSKELILFCKKWDLKYTIIGYFEAWYLMFENLKDIGYKIFIKSV